MKNTPRTVVLPSSLHTPVKDPGALRRMAEALRESEERYRILYEQTPSMYFTVDAEGTVLSINQFGAEQLGYDPNELIGKTVFGVFHHDDSDSARRHLETCLARPSEIHRWELRKVCRDGAEMRVKDTARAVVGPDGNTLILVVCEDITERWRAREALRIISEQTAPQVGVDFFQSLVRHLAGALHIRFAFISELCEENPQRVRTLAWWTGAECGENFEYALRDTPCEDVFSKDGACYPEEVQQRFPKDEWLAIHGIESYLAVPLYDRANNPIGHLGLMHDGMMTDNLPRENILRVLASRAAAELERKRAEEALRESEMRFRDYFKFQSIGIATSSPDKKWLDINDQLCRILGYSRDELLEKSWADLTHPDDLPTSMERFDEATKGELDGYILDKRFIRKDGLSVDVNVSIQCIRSRSGQLKYFLGVYQDVSERKKAETALRESEEHFRNLVEGSFAGILIHRDWKPLFVNQAYADIHGYESTNAILALDSIGSLIAPDEHARLRRYRDARRNGEPAPGEYEYQALRKDGATIVLRNLVRVVNWQGKLAFQNTVIDVTERHESELALRVSEARFRSLFEQSNDAVIIHTTDGKILDANNRACEMLGYDCYELISMWIPSLHPQREQDAAAKALRLVGEQESIRFESQFRRADGREIDVEISARIVDPEQRAVQAIVRDITERKHAEEALRRHGQMVSTCTDAMAFIDRTYIYRTVNTACSEAVARPKDEIIGRHVAEIMGKDIFESRLKSYLDRCLSGEHVNYQHWLNLPGSGWRFLDVHYDPFFDGDGAVSGVVADTRDITEWKQAEEQLRQHEDQLRTLASETSLMEERERRRIAADLHDGPVQNLALSRIKTGALRKLISSEEGSVLLNEIQALIDQTIRDTRSVVFELSPPVLYELGFEPALEWLAEQAETRHNFACEVHSDKQSELLDRNTEVVLFQAVRELLANVGKHAKATQASIWLRKQGEVLTICVEDDGSGFNVAAITPGAVERGGFGFFSIKERLAMLGGQLDIDSARDKGTRVTLTVPLRSSAGA